MDIENLNYQVESTDSSERQLSADNRPGDATSQYSNVSTQEMPMEVGCMPEVTTSSSELLHVHPLVLRFPFEPNKSIQCSLELTNNTDERVAFGLKGNSRAFRFKGFSGIVPSKSTCTLVVVVHEKLPEEYDVILQSSLLGDKYIVPFRDQSECDEFFEEAKEMGNAVHEVTLKAIFAPRGETTSEAIPPITQIIPHVANHNAGRLCFVDAHPTEPLILTSHNKGDCRSEVRLWNYGTPQENMQSAVCGEPAYSVKFIAQKQWFVAGTSDGFIHVYKYENEIQKLTSFKAHDDYVRSLAVHPTQSYVMSQSKGLIKLWDWNKGWLDFIKRYTGWKCTQTFEAEHSCSVKLVAFNPSDTNSFAGTTHDDHTIKVWNLDSPRPKYTLSGHSDEVNCLEFFTNDEHHCLITGSDDCTAKIWDLQKKTCIHTLEAFMSPVISVISLPDRPYLITGSRDGTVHMWSSTDFRLERMVSFGCSGDVPRLCLMGTRRIVIEQYGQLSFIDVDNEEAAR